MMGPSAGSYKGSTSVPGPQVRDLRVFSTKLGPAGGPRTAAGGGRPEGRLLFSSGFGREPSSGAGSLGKERARGRIPFAKGKLSSHPSAFRVTNERPTGQALRNSGELRTAPLTKGAGDRGASRRLRGRSAGRRAEAGAGRRTLARHRAAMALPTSRCCGPFGPVRERRSLRRSEARGGSVRGPFHRGTFPPHGQGHEKNGRFRARFNRPEPPRALPFSDRIRPRSATGPGTTAQTRRWGKRHRRLAGPSPSAGSGGLGPFFRAAHPSKGWQEQGRRGRFRGPTICWEAARRPGRPVPSNTEGETLSRERAMPRPQGRFTNRPGTIRGRKGVRPRGLAPRAWGVRGSEADGEFFPARRKLSV